MTSTQRVIVISIDLVRFFAVTKLLQLNHTAVLHVADAKELAEYATPGYHCIIDRIPMATGSIRKEDTPPELLNYLKATKLVKAHRRSGFMERTTWVDLEVGAYRCHTRLASEAIAEKRGYRKPKDNAKGTQS